MKEVGDKGDERTHSKGKLRTNDRFREKKRDRDGDSEEI